MARALRLLIPGGYYHITARGNDRRPIFISELDYRRFLTLLAELPNRFTVKIHAFVLMENHYHLLLQTMEPNVNHAIRWLNVSYSIWYNRQHQRSGHLLEGRYRAEIIETPIDVCEVARYLHLNPIRPPSRLPSPPHPPTTPKPRSKPPASVELARDPLKERLEKLNSYPWSSWRSHSGLEPRPPWLETEVVSASPTGIRGRPESRDALRQFTESPIRAGLLSNPWARLIGGMVLGSESYARSLLDGVKTDPEQQTFVRHMRQRIPWTDILRAVEKLRGRPFAELCSRHREWGRDAAVFLAVRHGGHRLAEVVRLIPDLRYTAAAQAVTRFSKLMDRNDSVRHDFAQLKKQFERSAG